MNPTLRLTEIFHSIQGESTWSGRRCVFVRLTGCHLRCHYCDTEYAFHGGRKWTLDEIVQQVRDYDCDLVEVTGGEPLLQAAVHPLMTQLCDVGHTVLLETSGACDISPCDPRVIRIMDLKTPGSGEADRNDWDNIARLRPEDEVKIVLTSRADYEWARDVLAKHDLASRVRAVLFSAVAPMQRGLEIAGVAGLPLADLAQWVLDDRLPVRLQTQLHKMIWDPMTRGV